MLSLSSLLTAVALGNGEETVTITEFSNGNGSLAAPRNRVKKSSLTDSEQTSGRKRDPRLTREWGAGKWAYFSPPCS